MLSVPYTTGQMSRDFAVTGKAGYEYGLGVRVLVDGSALQIPGRGVRLGRRGGRLHSSWTR